MVCILSSGQKKCYFPQRSVYTGGQTDNQLSDVQLCDVQLLWQPALVTSSSLWRPALCDVQLLWQPAHVTTSSLFMDSWTPSKQIIVTSQMDEKFGRKKLAYKYLNHIQLDNTKRWTSQKAGRHKKLDVTKAGRHKSWMSKELVVTKAGRHKSWLSEAGCPKAGCHKVGCPSAYPRKAFSHLFQKIWLLDFSALIHMNSFFWWNMQELW